jgi:Type I phosphodiesterase / nucleotide pyrophosphatase
MLVAGSLSRGSAQAPRGAGDNVILITLDGARTEEIFGGLQLDILRSTLRTGQTVEESPAYRQFWAETAQARREKLMPFFWKTLMAERGSIAGNPSLGSAVRLNNHHRFSYPGYAEILLGEPHDDVIKSNAPIRNPYTTVLEEMRDRRNLEAKQVATVGSWAHFNAIAEHTEGKTFVNAGQEPLSGSAHQLLNTLQTETSIPWDEMRHDAFTFQVAMAVLASNRPRVLYLALGETDDWAHDGRYDRVLEAYARSDRYLAQLWNWLESQPEYKGRTHVLITTDHGRGHGAQDWRDHGATIEGAQDVWMAFASPGMARRGEWQSHEPLSSSQIAATLAGWMNLDWNQMRPSAGRPIR